MKSHEIRSSFLDYFAQRGHRVVPSSSLIPQNDPTLLFANAGMNQFKNVFLGIEKRDYSRATSSQKCLRAGGKHNDLENVGFTARHHTFFEMLGNFSFGDYFKEDAIAFAWEYVTRTVGLDPDRLYATVYTEDDEAFRLWKKIAPALGERILRFGDKDNFWSMGETGPCGPCSEIHYDRGPDHAGELNGEGDRFMEIWNLVFMQYNRDDSGKVTPLPKPSVDTGAGLERFCMVLQNAFSNYETDLFEGLLKKVEELSGIEYSIGPKGVSHRVISDHVRALTFAIADGGIVSNEGRGYVLRRILRRAARHGRLLGLHEPFLYRIVQPLVDTMGGHYTEIKAKQGHIELVIRSEEEQFGRTLDTGLEIFEDIIKKAESGGQTVISGADVFRLYDTYGFPVDLTEVMADERGLHLDMQGFEKELDEQRERSKHASSFRAVSFDGNLPESKFEGYSSEKLNTQIAAVGQRDDHDYIVLKETPFYAESGGQIGDTGRIYSDKFEFIVSDTQKQADSIVHLGKITSDGNELAPRTSPIIAEVDHARRADIEANHTATHLLHKALRMVLGDHAHQAGSLVAPARLRFDFTHFKAMTPEELDQVERIVIEKINENLPVKWEYTGLEKAKEMGAMALFGEKYGDTVRMVKTGNFSLELCGGTHVEHTSEIGKFFITQETAIAAGMRRIEAITGSEAEKFSAEQNSIAIQLKAYMQKPLASLTDNDISQFKGLLGQAHRRYLHKENLLEPAGEFLIGLEKLQKEKQKDAQAKLAGKAGEIEPTVEMAGGKILVFVVAASDAKDLMVYSDSFKNTYPDSAMVTISETNGGLAITSPDSLLAKEIFQEIVRISGGRGGGHPTIRGSLPKDKINAAIEALKIKYNK